LRRLLPLGGRGDKKQSRDTSKREFPNHSKLHSLWRATISGAATIFKSHWCE
jgi:hypothetical protein